MSEVKPPNHSAVALFIDLENIRNGFHNVTGGFEPDISNFMRIGQRYGRVVHAAAFADFSRHPDNVKVDLNVAGIIIRDIPLKVSKRGGQELTQSSADMHMVMDIYETVINQPSVETFVICTGDSDFLRIITTLQNHYGKRVVVVAVPTTISAVLERAADEIILLDTPDPIIGGNNPHHRLLNGTARTFDELKHIIEPIIVLMKRLDPERYWTIRMLNQWVENPRNAIPGTHIDRANAISFMVNHDLILRAKKEIEGRGEVTVSELNEDDPIVREVLVSHGLLVTESSHVGTSFTPEEKQERVENIRGALEQHGLLNGIPVAGTSEEPVAVPEEQAIPKPVRKTAAKKTAAKKQVAKKATVRKPTVKRTTGKAG